LGAALREKASVGITTIVFDGEPVSAAFITGDVSWIKFFSNRGFERGEVCPHCIITHST
jgi:hypothetical protein